MVEKIPNYKCSNEIWDKSYFCVLRSTRVGLFEQNFAHLRSDWLPDESTCFAQFGMYRESIEEFVDNRDGSPDGISRLSSI